ncbi:MAG: hypothetical protein A2095_04605 [Sphingomonadales bacterium GWF1_63_6]|nr:MAG: hypothetical protein A2095_04605 [Sphingomonadales bacterium GWF1_63_6]
MNGHDPNRMTCAIVIARNLGLEEWPPAKIVQNIVHDFPMSITIAAVSPSCPKLSGLWRYAFW